VQAIVHIAGVTRRFNPSLPKQLVTHWREVVTSGQQAQRQAGCGLAGTGGRSFQCRPIGSIY